MTMSKKNQDNLIVFNELKVGHVRIQRRAIATNYRLETGDGQTLTKEFKYIYDEDLFDPADSFSQNIASLMAIQPALNYGLFCDTIILDGLFDDTDKRWVNDMIEVMSREILVNKFFKDNPYLKKEATDIAREKRKKYTGATIAFLNTGFPESQITWKHLNVDTNKHLLIGSGERSFLMTYSLLKETGKDINPVFMESRDGATPDEKRLYSYVQGQEHKTCRFSSNSQELFSWMIKNMPFFRKRGITSSLDIDPVHLWSAAISLFGALPLAFRRGTGRILTSNNYHTTQKSVFNGIGHFNGLYDRSKYFDSALTRYFMKKGWNISVFSILRSLSSALIDMAVGRLFSAIPLPTPVGDAFKGKDPQMDMKMRFDNERSVIKEIPEDLRWPVFNALLSITEGALKLINKRWQAFDLLHAEELREPYPFELTATKKHVLSAEQQSGKGYLWAEMSWPEIGERLHEIDLAIIPCGAIEQHGPHLPVDVDAFDAGYLARRVAEACSDPKPFVLPLVSYGVSYHHEDFPGTLSVSNDSLARYIYDIGMSLARQGIKKILFLNGHGDNTPTLEYAAQMINRDSRIFVCVETGESSDEDVSALVETPNDIHAGEQETSTSLATRPELVRMDKAKDMTVKFGSSYLDFSSSRGIPWYARTSKLTENGILGNPLKASAAKGKKMWEIMIAHLVKFVEELKNSSLEDLYQKKY
jgi:creatinine amidohydrolase